MSAEPNFLIKFSEVVPNLTIIMAKLLITFGSFFSGLRYCSRYKVPKLPAFLIWLGFVLLLWFKL